MANEVTINFNMLNTLVKYNIVGNFNVLVRANAARGARPWCLQVCDIQPQNWSDNYNIFLIFPHTKKKKYMRDLLGRKLKTCVGTEVHGIPCPFYIK